MTDFTKALDILRPKHEPVRDLPRGAERSSGEGNSTRDDGCRLPIDNGDEESVARCKILSETPTSETREHGQQGEERADGRHGGGTKEGVGRGFETREGRDEEGNVDRASSEGGDGMVEGGCIAEACHYAR